MAEPTLTIDAVLLGHIVAHRVAGQEYQRLLLTPTPRDPEAMDGFFRAFEAAREELNTTARLLADVVTHRALAFVTVQRAAGEGGGSSHG